MASVQYRHQNSDVFIEKSINSPVPVNIKIRTDLPVPAEPLIENSLRIRDESSQWNVYNNWRDVRVGKLKTFARC